MNWHDIQFAIADALEDERERRDLKMYAWCCDIGAHENVYEYLRNGKREAKLSTMIAMLEKAGLELTVSVRAKT